MRSYIGYIRVSTQRQGTQGVSLQEQRAAIERYAQRNKLTVSAWYEERVTAAKRGRHVFGEVLKKLAHGKANGIIIHKIDRGARNLKDWAELAELIDRGIEVHFAHDALDLRSRGGRLSADIQAVVAADFIRNLREETRKGFYGRLKQGIYPLRAPIGYRDMGRGRAKDIDPIQGPLVRTAFELYATEEWNFDTLQAEMQRRGLRSYTRRPISKNGLTTILNNPFYTGIIQLRKTRESFEGIHAPLISRALYDQVQRILRARRAGTVPLRYDFLFKQMIRCSTCGKHLIGEKQKGKYVYYRCHGSACAGTCISETVLEAYIDAKLSDLRFEPQDFRDLRDLVEGLKGNETADRLESEQSLRLTLEKLDERLTRLTDALIDCLIDKVEYERRRSVLIAERRSTLEAIESLEHSPSTYIVVTRALELTETAQLRYKSADSAEKRELIRSTCSNLSVTGKKTAITLRNPFLELSDLNLSRRCDLCRDGSRTFARRAFELMYAAAKEVGANDNITDAAKYTAA